MLIHKNPIRKYGGTNLISIGANNTESVVKDMRHIDQLRPNLFAGHTLQDRASFLPVLPLRFRQIYAKMNTASPMIDPDLKYKQ